MPRRATLMHRKLRGFSCECREGPNNLLLAGMRPFPCGRQFCRRERIPLDMEVLVGFQNGSSSRRAQVVAERKTVIRYLKDSSYTRRRWETSVPDFLGAGRAP